MAGKRLNDGSIIFPIKGRKAPGCPEGYEKDPNDEWRCFPILLPCVFRKEKEMENCCVVKMEMSCTHFGTEITGDKCVGCIERKVPEVS